MLVKFTYIYVLYTYCQLINLLGTSIHHLPPEGHGIRALHQIRQARHTLRKAQQDKVILGQGKGTVKKET